MFSPVIAKELFLKFEKNNSYGKTWACQLIIYLTGKWYPASQLQYLCLQKDVCIWGRSGIIR